MKHLKDFGLTEVIACEGWVQQIYNPQTESLQVNITVKIEGVSEKMICFLNRNHPLFQFFLQQEKTFYASVQAITTGTFNEQYKTLRVNLLAVEPIAYQEPLTVNIDELVQKLKAHLKRFNNKELYLLCREVLAGDVAFRNRVFNAPSHEKQAYCYRGGLLQHIVRLMDLIDLLVPSLAHNHFIEYQTYQMDVDLLKTAALYHDLGVANALYVSDKGTVERTLDGNLVGSTAISVEILTQMLMKKPLTDPYLALNLRAIIASCKADIEEGSGNNSRVLPKTKEAVFFANLERLEFHDARFQSLERELMEPDMIRHGGNLYVVPNRGGVFQSTTPTMVETETTTDSMMTENTTAETPSNEETPTSEQPMSTEDSLTTESTETEETFSFLSPLEPIEPDLIVISDHTEMNSTHEITSVEEQTQPSNDQGLTSSEMTPTTTIDSSFLNDEVVDSVIDLPSQSPTDVSMAQYEPLPIYQQTDGLNPYDVSTGLNPYESQLATPNFNPYAQPVDPETGMPIETMYSMTYEEGQPLDIPTTWPETPSTRPIIQK